MNAHSFAFKPAVRDRVGLLIGIAGSTGSGKTLSALKIARGLAGGDDRRIAFIDTERGRGKHYAPAPGEAAGGNRFGFAHGDLKAPFEPEAYEAAINAADDAGFEVIVIDSFSHSWDGYGGLQDIHTDLVEVAVEKARQSASRNNYQFDEDKARDKASISAWKEPKLRLKRMVARLLQCRAHLIICMRAEEKMLMETIDEEGRNGKTYKKTIIIPAKDRPVAERWVPTVEKRFPYELTLSLVLTPAEPGVPVPIKLQEQHRAAVPLDRPLTEETGRMLAAWAQGEAPVGKPQPQQAALTSQWKQCGGDVARFLRAYSEPLAATTTKEALVGIHNVEKTRFADAPVDVKAAGPEILALHQDRLRGNVSDAELDERLQRIIGRFTASDAAGGSETSEGGGRAGNSPPADQSESDAAPPPADVAQPPSVLSSSPDGGDPIAQAHAEGVQAKAKGMSKKASPAAVRADPDLLEAWQAGWSGEPIPEREPGQEG